MANLYSQCWLYWPYQGQNGFQFGSCLLWWLKQSAAIDPLLFSVPAWQQQILAQWYRFVDPLVYPSDQAGLLNYANGNFAINSDPSTWQTNVGAALIWTPLPVGTPWSYCAIIRKEAYSTPTDPRTFGRTWIPGIRAGYSSGRFLTAGGLSLADDLADFLCLPFTFGGVTFSPVVFSRRNNSTDYIGGRFVLPRLYTLKRRNRITWGRLRPALPVAFPPP